MTDWIVPRELESILTLPIGFLAAIIVVLLVGFLIYGRLSQHLLLCMCTNSKSKKLNHVLITGGSQGIGLCLAKEAVKMGANVSIMARNVLQLKNAKSEIESVMISPESQKVVMVSCDISKDYDTVKQAVHEAEMQLGNVTMLVNCAGVAKLNYFEELSVEDIKSQMDLNYMGSVYTTRAVINNMQKSRNGSLVFVSSQGGQLGIIGMTAYSPTKYAVRGLAEALRNELIPFGISISIIYPPDTDTPGLAKENLSKPTECAEISETAGLFKPEVVASKTLKEALNGTYSVTFGLDGFMLDTVTCGMNPYPGLLRCISQVMLMGIFRLVAIFYTASFDNVVKKHSYKRKVKPQY